MNEHDFSDLLRRLEAIGAATTHQAAALLGLYREALGWVASHDSVSIAASMRKQRVAEGARTHGKRPHEVLGGRDPKERR